MSSAQTIEVVISPAGETEVTTRGFAGSSCQQASKFIEEALGDRTSETLTIEFYATTAAAAQLQQGQ